MEEDTSLVYRKTGKTGEDHNPAHYADLLLLINQNHQNVCNIQWFSNEVQTSFLWHIFTCKMQKSVTKRVLDREKEKAPTCFGKKCTKKKYIPHKSYM